MTWEELVEFAKDYGFEEETVWCKVISNNCAMFFQDGIIKSHFYEDDVAEHRTYEQMKVIIENMYDKEN